MTAAPLRKVVPDGLVGFGTVEVVGIDHGEGFADGVGRHHHGVVGAPRLDAPFGNSSSLGQVVQLLEHELHGDAAAETLRGEDFAELLFERVADDENDLAETGADGVVDRIIYDGKDVADGRSVDRCAANQQRRDAEHTDLRVRAVGGEVAHVLQKV